MAVDTPTLIDDLETAYDNAQANPGAGNRSLAEAVGPVLEKWFLTGTADVTSGAVTDSLNAKCNGVAPLK